MRNGIVLILLSMSLTPLGDALSKNLSAIHSPLFIVFLRYFTAGLIALVLAGITRTPVRIAKRDMPGMVVRTALVISAMSCLIVALSKVSLAIAVGGFLIAPIVAMVISVAVLKQNLTPAKSLGAGVSFLGALTILQPSSSIEIGVVYALMGGGLLGAFLAFSSRVPQGGHPIAALAVQCLLGAAMLVPFLIGIDLRMSAGVLPTVLGLGVVTAATHFLTVAAYQKATASTLAPFFYFNLIAAVFVGLIWFGEVPNEVTLLGLGGIMLGGLISLGRISLPVFRRKRKFAPKNPFIRVA